MEYQWSYFEDEVRDGFFVPGIMKKCWASAQKNYEDLREFCQKRGIPCAAEWGTMMGAVRHGGFIPWDDDLDVAMSREDYTKLFEARTQKDFHSYRLYDYRLDRGTETKLTRAFTNHEDPTKDWDKHFGFPFSDVIDIFIYDHVPDEGEERVIYENMLDKFAALFGQGKPVSDKKKSEYLKDISKELGLVFMGSTPLTVQVMKALEKFCERYSSQTCQQQAMIWEWYMKQGKKQIFDRRLFEHYIEVPFEHSTVHIPVGYDRILRTLYPGYMVPKAEWDSHGYPCFMRMEQQMREIYGLRLLRYEYHPEEVFGEKKKREEKADFSSMLIQSLDLFSQAHQYIIEQVGKKECGTSVLDTLEQCQALAIRMGEQIERKSCEPEQVIPVLEKYCDFVYQMYQKISGGDPEVDAKALTGYERQMTGGIKNLREKKEIVFLVDHSKNWKSFHTLWEEMQKREDVQTVVIPVPFYYRNFDGEPEPQPRCETDGYPEEVTLTSFEEYSFENRHPDVILYQNPYDEYNYAMSVHPFFYSKNLRQYTGKMALIPSFELREIMDGDERAKYTLRWFLHTPGLVYADEVYVQSGQMKKIYTELLSEMTGESEGVTGQTIYATGLPLKEYKDRQRILFCGESTGELYEHTTMMQAKKTIYDVVESVPQEWIEKVKKQDGGRKKILVYYVSGSVLYEYGEKMVDKIRQFISLTEQYIDDLCVIWYRDPYAKEILEDNLPEIWEAYQEWMDVVESKKEYILVREKNDDRLAAFCDAIYGDGGTLMNACRLKGRMVLFETPDRPLEGGESSEDNHWTEDTLVAIEGEWTLKDFIEELLEKQQQGSAFDHAISEEIADHLLGGQG